MDILLTNIWRFFDPMLFGVVLGCVLIMAWIQNGRQSIVRAFAALANSGRNPFEESGENAIFICRRIDFTLREQGLSGLETVRSEDAFVVRILGFLVDAKHRSPENGTGHELHLIDQLIWTLYFPYHRLPDLRATAIAGGCPKGLSIKSGAAYDQHRRSRTRFRKPGAFCACQRGQEKCVIDERRSHYVIVS